MIAIPHCISDLLARKAVRESYSPSSEVLALMRSFKEMTNACIRIGLADDASTRMRLTYLAYHDLAKFHVTSYCKVCAISKAAGIPVIQLTKAETRGTSSSCYRCGERLQGAAREDVQHERQLWCPKCGVWLDRPGRRHEHLAQRVGEVRPSQRRDS